MHLPNDWSEMVLAVRFERDIAKDDDLVVARDFLKSPPQIVRRQGSLDRTGGLNKGEFLAHRNVHRSEDETANPTIEGTG